jgi:drug/metabolite transporter (DMT)-like permease
MATAACLALVVAPLTGGFLRGIVHPRELLAVLYLAVFGSCVAYTAHGYLARTWNPVRLGTYAYLNPVIAVLLGVALLGEDFSLRMAGGMLVILLGVALVQLRSAGR